MLHEQNAVLGRVNRYMAPRVDAVACAFPTLLRTPRKVKPEVVGNPVRPDIRALYDQPYPPMDRTLRILVTGGSQGARLLSEFTPGAIINLPEDLRLRVRVEQQTRMENLDSARSAYLEAGVEAEVAPFFRNMAGRLEKAHLVIGRAGASTVCELAVAGKPSILIPLKIAADDHQTANAKLLSDAGAAEVIREDRFTSETLGELIQALLSDPDGLRRRAEAARSVAAPDASERLADLVERTARA
jgi:UDP-N-acetylglucosamine--N-acetylmuramyl-(pentapeptide) pyrophosphoryl-undecaprenol N-acetylglucosamine transferase